MTELSDFLEHYGTKGMRWGVRKKRTAKEQRARSKRQSLSDKRRTLSDKDLKKFIERLSDEKKLKTLVNEDLKPGRTIAKKILSESGQKAARTAIAGVALYGGKVALTKQFDRKEAAQYITPKPKNK